MPKLRYLWIEQEDRTMNWLSSARFSGSCRLKSRRGPGSYGRGNVLDMQPLSPDTPLDVEKIWIEAQRRLGPVERLRRAVEMTEFCWQAGIVAVQRAHPRATPAERDRILITERYGSEIAEGFVAERIRRGFYD